MDGDAKFPAAADLCHYAAHSSGRAIAFVITDLPPGTPQYS